MAIIPFFLPIISDLYNGFCYIPIHKYRKSSGLMIILYTVKVNSLRNLSISDRTYCKVPKNQRAILHHKSDKRKKGSLVNISIAVNEQRDLSI